MTDIEKFYADVQRIKKHYRSEHQNYDGLAVCNQIAELFQKCNKDLGGLPNSIGEYWISNYVSKSSNPQEEPSDENLAWLATVLSFLDASLSPEQDIPKKDWEAIHEFINYEAETLPIAVLTDLMGILVEKKVL